MRQTPLKDHRRTGNRLLDTLAPDEFDRLRPHLEAVSLPVKQMLSRPGEPIEHVYFVQKGLVSLVTPLADGELIEVGIVGAEGFVGAPALLGAAEASAEMMVQMPGAALRIKASVLRDEAERRIALLRPLLLYVQALHSQAMQSAACNARHTLSERLARWLLTAHDRADGDELPLSHEFIATMLGVRRSGVTVAIGALKTAGLIKNTQKWIAVVDRDGLEEASCECYRAVKQQYDRLLS